MSSLGTAWSLRRGCLFNGSRWRWRVGIIICLGINIVLLTNFLIEINARFTVVIYEMKWCSLVEYHDVHVKGDDVMYRRTLYISTTPGLVVIHKYNIV